MEYTKNLHLKKPSDNDDYDIKNENDNMDILDAAFNMGDIVKVDTEKDLPEPTEENKAHIFYCKDTEKYFYLREINGSYYYQLPSYRTNQTFNVDSDWLSYQHTMDTDKWYKGSRKTIDTDFVLIEGSLEPSGSFAEGTLVFCYVDNSNYKLFRFEDGNFIEMSNIGICNGENISLYSVENDNYYYCVGSRKLKYFDKNDWEEIEVIHYDFDERPPFIKYYADKYYITLRNELIYIGITKVGELNWEQLQTSIDLLNLRKDIDLSKMEIVSFDYYMRPEASEETMGKIYYCDEYSLYLISNRKEILSSVVATTQDGSISYREGLLEDRPDARTGGCRCYYATDVDKYYIRTSGSGGLIMYFWEEVVMNKQSWMPSLNASNIGYYYFDRDTYIEIISIYGTYDWVDLIMGDKDKYKTITIPISGWTENTDSDGNNYYTIEINVYGMYVGFTGLSDTDYVRPNTYNVNANETLKENFKKITKIESMKDKIKVYTNEPITQSFQIIIYGV